MSLSNPRHSSDSESSESESSSSSDEEKKPSTANPTAHIKPTILPDPNLSSLTKPSALPGLLPGLVNNPVKINRNLLQPVGTQFKPGNTYQNQLLQQNLMQAQGGAAANPATALNLQAQISAALLMQANLSRQAAPVMPPAINPTAHLLLQSHLDAYGRGAQQFFDTKKEKN